MAPTTKSSRKSSTKKSAKTVRGGSSSFLKTLPQSVEHIEIVQQVAGVFSELQKRVLDVKAEASKELKKIMKRYESNYKGLEKKVHEVTSEAKKQAQTSMIHLLQKWHEHKDKLPKPMAKEIEKIIEQIGAKMVMGQTKKTSARKKTSATRRKKSAAAKRKSLSSKKVTTTKKTSARNSGTSSSESQL